MGLPDYPGLPPKPGTPEYLLWQVMQPWQGESVGGTCTCHLHTEVPSQLPHLRNLCGKCGRTCLGNPALGCALHSKPLSRFRLYNAVGMGIMGNSVRDRDGQVSVELHTDGTICLPE